MLDSRNLFLDNPFKSNTLGQFYDLVFNFIRYFLCYRSTTFFRRVYWHKIDIVAIVLTGLGNRH